MYHPPPQVIMPNIIITNQTNSTSSASASASAGAAAAAGGGVVAVTAPLLANPPLKNKWHWFRIGFFVSICTGPFALCGIPCAADPGYYFLGVCSMNFILAVIIGASVGGAES